ncbi:hypothetical protein IWW55_007309 [Coemansia sp. RSA 2706]|nr:hypothetical protein IWW55_007309 [Coemansia sp. RSA 2706]KAJ2309992.1 hypothetical protein IWW52_005542 [Coemansia sp. RSA 2704]
MNGRFFGGRQVEASIYDGQTRYRSSKDDSKMANAADAEEARMAHYAEWLDSGN